MIHRLNSDSFIIDINGVARRATWDELSGLRVENLSRSEALAAVGLLGNMRPEHEFAGQRALGDAPMSAPGTLHLSRPDEPRNDTGPEKHDTRPEDSLPKKTQASAPQETEAPEEPSSGLGAVSETALTALGLEVEADVAVDEELAFVGPLIPKLLEPGEHPGPDDLVLGPRRWLAPAIGVGVQAGQVVVRKVEPEGRPGDLVLQASIGPDGAVTMDKLDRPDYSEMNVGPEDAERFEAVTADVPDELAASPSEPAEVESFVATQTAIDAGTDDLWKGVKVVAREDKGSYQKLTLEDGVKIKTEPVDGEYFETARILPDGEVIITELPSRVVTPIDPPSTFDPPIPELEDIPEKQRTTKVFLEVVTWAMDEHNIGVRTRDAEGKVTEAHSGEVEVWIRGLYAKHNLPFASRVKKEEHWPRRLRTGFEVFGIKDLA